MHTFTAPPRPGRRPAAALLATLLASAPVAADWTVTSRVVIEHGKLVIDHGKGIAEITQAQRQGGLRADIGLGLFQNRIRTEWRVAPSVAGARGGRLAVTVRITTDPLILVAREFPADSCAYRVVLGHELLHQKFDREVLRALPDEVRRIVQDIYSPDALTRGAAGEPERARGRFFQQFDYVYAALGQPLHQSIDNPDAYRQLAQACNGEIGRRLAPAPGLVEARNGRPTRAATDSR